MSLTLDLITFTTKFINNCADVKSSRLDKTIKAIINTYSSRGLEDSNALFLIDYLNKLRIIYYLKRLDYYKPSKALRLKSKLSNLLLYSITNSSLDLVYRINKERRSLNLDYTLDLLEASKDSPLSKELKDLNAYILYYSIIFKDPSKLL